MWYRLVSPAADDPRSYVRASWVEVHCDTCPVPLELHWLISPDMAPEPDPYPYSAIGRFKLLVDTAEDHNEFTTTFTCEEGELEHRATLLGMVERMDGTVQCVTSGVDADALADDRGCIR